MQKNIAIKVSWVCGLPFNPTNWKVKIHGGAEAENFPVFNAEKIQRLQRLVGLICLAVSAKCCPPELRVELNIGLVGLLQVMGVADPESTTA